jgi:ParE toxin of type II toxin-antitoxin system, parDE
VAGIVFAGYLLDLLNELPLSDLELIEEKTEPLARFPRMYPMRQKGRFRRHRWFRAGNWIVNYKVVDETVYIRNIWPAQIP